MVGCERTAGKRIRHKESPYGLGRGGGGTGFDGRMSLSASNLKQRSGVIPDLGFRNW